MAVWCRSPLCPLALPLGLPAHNAPFPPHLQAALTARRSAGRAAERRGSSVLVQAMAGERPAFVACERTAVLLCTALGLQ